MSKLIPLTQNQFTIIDDEDYEKVNQYKWFALFRNNGIVACRKEWKNNKSKTIYLSRFIMNCPKNKLVDHINHNTLLNCKYNLRIVTKSQNAMNSKKRKNTTSKYKGVTYIINKRKIIKRWIVNIRKNNKSTYIGTFNTEKEGAIAYNFKAKELFGEYAYLNEV